MRTSCLSIPQLLCGSVAKKLTSRPALTPERTSGNSTAGAIVPASASPSVVPLPYSDAAAVDPEEAFVAALASCHMLWFLDLAARAGYVVDRYLDRPEGILDRNEAGKLAITVVTLRPQAIFAGQVPVDEVLRLHRRAHEVCYLANSVVTDVRIDPQGVEQ